MSLLAVAGANSAVAGGYDIDNSLKTEGTNTEYLYRTLGTPTDLKKVTISFWIKRTELGRYWSWGTSQETTGDLSVFRIFFEPDDQIAFQDYDTTNNYRVITTRYFRDTSAWYHIVGVVDTTNATADDRMKLYINGVQETNFHTRTNFALNHEVDLQSGKVLNIARYVDNGSTTYAERGAYLADWIYVDGQALEPTDFGEFDTNTGIWKPKNYTGTYGNNGYRLKFDNASNLGEDSSGNGNNFTLNNITSADQATDTPTNNFCTINAVNLSTQILTEGATKIVSTDNTSRTSFGTMAVSKGKWWWEGKIQVYESNDTYPCIGVTGDLDNLPATSAQSWGTNHVIKLAKAQKWVSNATGTLYGTAYADNDIINIALDMDNHIMYTYKNGTIDDASGINFSSQSAATAGNFYIPINLVYITGGGSSWEMNFGGYANYTITSAATDANGYGVFEFAPPSGYYALCSKNLAEFG